MLRDELAPARARDTGAAQPAAPIAVREAAPASCLLLQGSPPVPTHRVDSPGSPAGDFVGDHPNHQGPENLLEYFSDPDVLELHGEPGGAGGARRLHARPRHRLRHRPRRPLGLLHKRALRQGRRAEGGAAGAEDIGAGAGGVRRRVEADKGEPDPVRPGTQHPFRDRLRLDPDLRVPLLQVDQVRRRREGGGPPISGDIPAGGDGVPQRPPEGVPARGGARGHRGADGVRHDVVPAGGDRRPRAVLDAAGVSGGRQLQRRRRRRGLDEEDRDVRAVPEDSGGGGGGGEEGDGVEGGAGGGGAEAGGAESVRRVSGGVPAEESAGERVPRGQEAGGDDAVLAR